MYILQPYEKYATYFDINVTVSPRIACVYDKRSRKKLALVIAIVPPNLPLI